MQIDVIKISLSLSYMLKLSPLNLLSVMMMDRASQLKNDFQGSRVGGNIDCSRDNGSVNGSSGNSPQLY